jgi:ribosomal protein S18 acetylase RimI-like enzyme
MKDEALVIRKARPDELARVMGMLKGAAEWLRGRGIDLWQNWQSPSPKDAGWVRGGFERGEFRMVEMGGEVVGCLRLQSSDPEIWGERGGAAGYIHSFTIDRRLAGRGIGRRVLERIATECRDAGKAFLRLDCGTHVAGLRRYYQGCGFQEVGEAKYGENRLTLYEMTLDEEASVDHE